MYNMHISANSKTLLYKKEFLLKNFFIYYIYMTVTTNGIYEIVSPQHAHQYQNSNLIILASSHSTLLI